MKLCLLCKKRSVSKGLCCAHCLLKKHLTEIGCGWQTEVVFHPQRKWRWDFVLFPDLAGGSRIAVEIQGQIWHKGGHTSGKGMQRDMDKRNAGVMLGWRVLTFSTDDVIRGRAKAFIYEHLFT
jgi:hypothetical protein